MEKEMIVDPIEVFQNSMEVVECTENADQTMEGILSVSQEEITEQVEAEKSLENVEQVLEKDTEENNEMLQQLLHIKSKVEIEKKVQYDMNKESLLFNIKQLEARNGDLDNELESLLKELDALKKAEQLQNQQSTSREFANIKMIHNVLCRYYNEAEAKLQNHDANLSQIQEKFVDLNNRFNACKVINLKIIGEMKNYDLLEISKEEIMDLNEENRRVAEDKINQSRICVQKSIDLLNKSRLELQWLNEKHKKDSKKYDVLNISFQEVTSELQMLNDNIATLETDRSSFEEEKKLELQTLNDLIYAKQKCLEETNEKESQLLKEFTLLQNENKVLEVEVQQASEKRLALKQKLDELMQIKLNFQKEHDLNKILQAGVMESMAASITTLENEFMEFNKQKIILDEQINNMNKTIEITNNDFNKLMDRKNSFENTRLELSEEIIILKNALGRAVINHKSLELLFNREKSNLTSKKLELEKNFASRSLRIQEKTKILEDLKKNDNYEEKYSEFENLRKNYEEKTIAAKNKFEEKESLLMSEQNNLKEDIKKFENEKNTLLTKLEELKNAREIFSRKYNQVQDESSALQKEKEELKSSGKKHVVSILKSPNKSPSTPTKNVTFRNKVSIENMSQSTTDTFMEDFLQLTRNSQIPNRDDASGMHPPDNIPSTSRSSADPFDMLLNQQPTTSRSTMRRHYNRFDAPEKDK